ncbi:TetR/AcrR family transcriptional regulator [Variovorax terrae]|uniref:TetR/AcrR family transcriptional regulator n=1 Tax=Variovorax terrae TaxID=2923278 RepID=A0A9X1VVT6_9BURK|nr:TetR/AcrR family transcriptional regulator [Variovorax terrae]MCJ0764124.1 TetR/AcrR family transcriptional regulator [Variovorax terrae]
MSASALPPVSARSPAVAASRPGRPVSLEKRQAILEAAIDEFTEHGYDHASVDAIAARAEVSKRTLYNHFGSKEGLFAALVDEVAQRISMSASIEYEAAEPLRAQLLRYANESRRLMSRPANLRLLRAVLAEHIRHPQRVEPVLEKYWRTEYGFTDWVEAARRDGRLAGDPVRLGQVMSSMMKSIIFWPTVLGRGTPSHKQTDAAMSDAIEMFLQFYGAARQDR